MEVWAHRGWSSRFKENTIQSYEEAIKTGVTGIELDVRIAKDDVVAYKDPTLWRFARTWHSVKKLYAKQISEMVGFDVPTLDRVLDLFGDSTRYIINLNTSDLRDSSLERKVISSVKSKNLEDMVIFSSSNPISLSKIYSGTDGKSSLALIKDDKWRMRNFSHMILPFNSIHVKQELINRQRLRRWKRMGLRVRAWNVNTYAYMERLKEIGVDGFISDKPEIIMR